MKKKLLVIMMLLVTAIQLVACGDIITPTCKEDGCDDTDIYEEGYCEYHYYENIVGNAIEDILK